MKRITSRSCGGVREGRCLSLVKHPEEHKKETCLRKGIVLVFGWLELVLGVLLALDVLGWRKSRERNNGEAP